MASTLLTDAAAPRLDVDQSWIDFAHLVLTDQFPTESAVDRWLQALTVRQRLVLFLAVVQELEGPEIGELLGLADSAVRMTMARIRTRLITIPLDPPARAA